jgi:hypothetical protein
MGLEVAEGVSLMILQNGEASSWIDMLTRGGGGRGEKDGTTPCTACKNSNSVWPDQPKSRATSGSAQQKRSFGRQLPPYNGHGEEHSCYRSEHRFRRRRHASYSGACRVPLAIGTGCRAECVLRNGLSCPSAISYNPSERLVRFLHFSGGTVPTIA